MDERAARGLVRDKERLFLLEAGGTPERPIDCASASVIDVKWRAMPCPQCGGSLRLVDEQAEDGAHRSVRLKCAACGAPRTVYYRIVPTGN
ncbi:MAG: hypothetical protein ABI321_19195 [Polyangia bacterium]